MKLNIGCGSNKIADYINIDTEATCNPDLLHNIMDAPLPYGDGEVEEILFFHCIEHIRKCYHQGILSEFYRVLQSDGKLYISYPNFWECAKRWKDNAGGQKKFWEATLYGRQLYETDYHVCAMDPNELTDLLYSIGYGDVVSSPELGEIYNSITFAKKSGAPRIDYEALLINDIKHMGVVQK